MNEEIAQQLLATVMGWDRPERPDLIDKYFWDLQLLANYKYDSYQQFTHGRHFIEGLATWLQQFAASDREVALKLVRDHLVFVSDAEFFHLVNMAYADVIAPERMRLVAEESGLSNYLVGQISDHRRFRELGLKSLYLGLSDGARTSELRRSAGPHIRNDQIWQAYELGEEKGRDLLTALGESLEAAGFAAEDPRFTLVWLLDDFTASGNTYIRLHEGQYKGKLPRVYDTLHRSGLVDPTHYEVLLLFYVATRQAVDHIEYWTERFTSDRGYTPVQVRVLHLLEQGIALDPARDAEIERLIETPSYYDPAAETKATRVGRTADVRHGFAGCALPIVLYHNTPNNSIYLLWGEEGSKFPGLFPRVSRHRDT
jgi:hypothetical protein